MAGTCIIAGYVHPHNHPHTQLKKSRIPYTHTHTQSMRGFPVKTGTSSGNTHGASLFVISISIVITVYFISYFVIFIFFLNVHYYFCFLQFYLFGFVWIIE